MRSNRRKFLGQSSAVMLGALPALVCRGAGAGAGEGIEANRDGRVLVVIQMSGGNDGVNTVVPFGDEGYAKHRSKLRLPTDRLIKIDDSTALHPSMRSAADLLEEGKLAIVQGVGYPNPSRSHDTSMAIWHSAEIGDENTLRSHGWLGKAMDSVQDSAIATDSDDPDMILLGDESQPLAIQSRRSIAVAFSNLTTLRLRALHPQVAEREQPKYTSHSLGRFVEQTMRNATATATAISRLSMMIAVLCGVVAQCQANDAAERPNILLIVSDDQGYNDLGLLGNGIITPSLDRLANEGTRLTQFYVSWPACTPSRASILTGRYPQRNGIYDMIRNEAPDYGQRYSPAEYDVTFERVGGMDSREKMLPEVLSSVGYVSGNYG